MKPDFEKVCKCIVKQNQHIEIFNDGSKEEVAHWLQEELLELFEVLENGSFDEISLMSEIGDVQYLLIRLSQMCGIDLMEAVLSKVARNYHKYYKKETRESARKEWGDKDHQFLDNWVTNYRNKIDKLANSE
jgi:NTP pyrophosphatase (non-canonical NTP hydrolase)